MGVDNRWLNYVNSLNGCYLVSEAGVRKQKYDYDSGADSNAALTTANYQFTCEGISPNVIAQVLSHEVDTSDGTLNILLLPMFN